MPRSAYGIDYRSFPTFQFFRTQENRTDKGLAHSPTPRLRVNDQPIPRRRELRLTPPARAAFSSDGDHSTPRPGRSPHRGRHEACDERNQGVLKERRAVICA